VLPGCGDGGSVRLTFFLVPTHYGCEILLVRDFSGDKNSIGKTSCPVQETKMLEQANATKSRRRWLGLWFCSLAVFYSPFLAAAAYTWLFVDCPHCKVTWLKYFWVLPGLTLAHCSRYFGFDLSLNDIATIAISTVWPIIIVSVVAWLVGKGGILRWIVWAVCGLLSTLAAIMAFWLVRA
jgi:hypothetical protein